MSRIQDNEIDFADVVATVSSGQVWEYETGAPATCRDVPGQTFSTLQSPIDFPPLEAAIVAGDRIALAVDANAPSVVEVIQGCIKALGQTEAGEIDIVLSDEATDATLAEVRAEVGEAIQVARHRSSDRGSLRYVGADHAADPIYLNRLLVDADFVLPIVAGRPLDTCCAHDLTGVFPTFADSASRRRHRQRNLSEPPNANQAAIDPSEAAWLLGVMVMISVTASDSGEAGQILAGTPDAIQKQLTQSLRLPVEAWCKTEEGKPDEFPPPAPLVIASIDGGSQQQSWCNAARAIAAASRYTESGGTIVLWSAIDDAPAGRLLNLADTAAADNATEEPLPEEEEDFPAWDESISSAQTLVRIASEHRILIHSRLDEETIESMGLAAIASTDELERLSSSFNSCGVLRAAQFAGTTLDTNHQIAP